MTKHAKLNNQPRQPRFQKKLDAEKDAITEPLSELISVEVNYKRVKKDLQKAWKKLEDQDNEGTTPPDEPSKPPKKRKGKLHNAGDQAEEEPEAPEPKRKKGKRSKGEK